jgi:hypothetical protein
VIIIRIRQLAVAAAFTVGLTAIAQNIPKGFAVPKCTLSPDGRYGVTVPILDQHEDSEDPKNAVIELTTGRIIAIIDTSRTGWNRMGHGGVLPCRWSPDGSLLLWEVDGKWFPAALVLLKFSGGVLEWQTDITAAAQSETLLRTKRTAPDQYAKAKKANAGNGSAYPEGFSIYVAAFDPISFPLHIRATLTADPKEIEDFPKLESYLDAVVDPRGKLVVTDFHVGSGYWRQFVETVNVPEPCNFEESNKEGNGKQ